MKDLLLIFLLGCTSLPTEHKNSVVWHSVNEPRWVDSCYFVAFKCEQPVSNIKAICNEQVYPVYALVQDSTDWGRLKIVNVLQSHYTGYAYLPDTVYQIIGEVLIARS